VIDWLVRTLPREDRVWGEAWLRELEAVPAHARAAWALGLLGFSGARNARRLIPRRGDRIGLSIGAIASLIVAGDIAYSNLGPRSAHPAAESVGPTLIAFGLLGALFLATGFFARARGARTAALTAVVIVLAAFVTTLVIDNVWLHTVARQPDKIYGLAHSPLFHTMRAFLIGQDILGLLIVTPLAAAVGAALGALGARLRSAARPCS
jgi:hypothetical protein